MCDVLREPLWPSGKAGERTTSVRFPVSTLPSLQKLWFKDAVFSEPVWPSGKALGW